MVINSNIVNHKCDTDPRLMNAKYDEYMENKRKEKERKERERFEQEEMIKISAVQSGKFILSEKIHGKGEEILWAKNISKNIGKLYLFDKNLEIIAPDDYKIMLKSVNQSGGIEMIYNTLMTQIPDLHVNY